MKLLISPHADDETLFCAYTLMRERLKVVIVTDGYAQQAKDPRLDFTYIDRRLETMRAMSMLGLEVDFLEISDINFRDNLDIFEEILRSYNPSKVYAPMVEGGNEIHDLVGLTANKMFGGLVEYYSTYTKERPYPEAFTEIRPTEKERALKLKMLECYETQKNLSSTKIYFEYAKRKSEYRSLLCRIPASA